MPLSQGPLRGRASRAQWWRMSTESTTPAASRSSPAPRPGIGAATARALAADGYRVALLARRADRIQALADELGDGAIAIEADVTDRDALVAAAERVQDELGGADILVNNAGVMLLGPFTSEQRADYRQMVEVNLLGAITATEVFLDQLARRRRRHRQHLLGRRPHRPRRQRRLRGHQVGHQRLVGVAAPGAAARRPRDRHRARRRRDRADRPHHPRARPSRATSSSTTQTAITAEDIAEIIAFAVSRPRSVSLNEILVRPHRASSG